MFARKTKNVSLSLLKSASFNPVNRLEKSRLRDLAKSVGEIGLLYPILITQKNEIIDGHRRVAVAKDAGWQTIPAIVVEGDQAKLYASVNTTGRRLSGNDSLGIWLKNRDAVSPRTSRFLEDMVEHIGMALAQKMYRAGFSIKAYNMAVQFGRYVGNESDEFIEQTILWGIKHRQLRQLYNIQVSGSPGEAAAKAIERNVPIKIKFAMAI